MTSNRLSDLLNIAALVRIGKSMTVDALPRLGLNADVSLAIWKI